ncbi:MAG TPA: transketolase C-terminal domain-containing protein, partial [Microbacteriaceae bacterium]|nr:transketolase C-terminal domain-containing protein [Microbacteriaceae bacterium]
TGVKDVLAPQGLFSDLGLKYVGPVDGHDIGDLERALEAAHQFEGPVVVHCYTQKGKGFRAAEEHELDRFHAVGQIDAVTGEPVTASGRRTWTEAFSDAIIDLARADERVCAITAAMLHPTGLDRLKAELPERVFDVGIAEQHGVTFAAGLARGGFHPVFAVYSTFLNRAFDQLLMDVALHRLGVTFVLDRAGVTGPDGPSHHGIWDLAMLQIVPHIRIAAPRDAARLVELLDEAVAVSDAPTVVRFPKGEVGADIPAIERLEDGVELLARGGAPDVLLVAIGPMAALALGVAERLRAAGIGATVVDPRWAVPVQQGVVRLAAEHRLVITLEDGVRVGGIGTSVRQVLRDAGVDTAVDELGVPDDFIQHASREQILEDAGLTAAKISDDIIGQVRGTRIPIARPTAV